MQSPMLRVYIAGTCLILGTGCERPINRDDDVDVSKLAAGFGCAQPNAINPESCRLVKEFTAGTQIGIPTAEMAHMAGESICTMLETTRTMRFMGLTPPFQFRYGDQKSWPIGSPDWKSLQTAVNTGTSHPTFGSMRAHIDMDKPTTAMQSNGISVLLGTPGRRAVWWHTAKAERAATTYLRRSSTPASNALITIDPQFMCITEYKPITN
jgi:hypothetical protein